jgi:hypothetical protein
MTIPLLCLSLRAGSHPRFADIDTSPLRSWKIWTVVDLGGQWEDQIAACWVEHGQ